MDILRQYGRIWSENARDRGVKVLLLTDVYFSVSPRTRQHDRPVRRRKGAFQQKTNVKVPSALLQSLIFTVQNVGRRRGQFAEQEQIAAFDFSGADTAKLLLPMRRDVECRVRPYPVVRIDHSRWNVSVNIDVKTYDRVFLPVFDPHS